ncbi:hypothetical protein IFM89_021222 [Coptis chinensis]|uniref:CCHC-type domain-containing protein n=1 Tax=Coptis chinensis TaxID=261450 RepID=A0A835HEM5_9MAGN|nr:hypothetical protein IFM89_021222 [Coptis chinensis]
MMKPCTLMELKKLNKKRALNANDKGNSKQKKNNFNDKRFDSKENKKSGKDKGETKGKKNITTHMKDTELLEYVDVPRPTTDDLVEIDIEVGFRNQPRQPRESQLDEFDLDDGYHKEIVMSTSSDEWKVGMEWSDIETLRHEIFDYCINNRFEVDTRTVNERYMIKAKCKGSYKGKDYPWVAYWRLRFDAFTVRLNTFVNENIYYANPELKNGIADVNWVARKIAPQIKVHYKTMSPRLIMDEVKRGDFHVSINYWTSWHARLKCLQNIHGDYGASYNMLHVLCDQDIERQIMPLSYVSGIGRPKKARTRGEVVEVNPNKKIRFCCKCKQPGHNAKTCKSLPTTKKDKHVKES